MLVPLRAGNSNRSDLKQIADSLLQQRGDAVTKDVGSVVWIEVQAHARAIYSIWCVNQKLANQFDPNKMSDFLTRWETILQLSPLPTDTLTQRRGRIAAKFLALNKLPNTSQVHDLLAAGLPDTFLDVINVACGDAISFYPGGSHIVGGSQAGNGPWYSTTASIFVETTQPTYLADGDFQNQVNQVSSILGQYLPAWTDFDWFASSFRDDGHADGYTGTLTASAGSFTLTGTNTAWNTPINALDNTYNIEPGSILECFDDTGAWQRMTVASVVSDTSILLTEPVPNSITAKTYVIEGFFLDCDPHSFPYPPATSKNLDVAGLNNH